MLSKCTNINIVKQTPSLHVGFWYIIIKLGHRLKKSKLFGCYLLSECTKIVKQTPFLHDGVWYIIIKLSHCLEKSKLFRCYLNVPKSLSKLHPFMMEFGKLLSTVVIASRKGCYLN